MTEHLPASKVSTIPPSTPAPRGRLEAPVRPSQRILTIDILRGFALLGILLVNMALFNQSVLTLAMKLVPPATPLDQVADWFIKFFAEGKFYSIFSILFGLGMAIQYSRAQERNARFGPFWIRRMLVLLGFGLIHAYLFWPGDILILYAVAGIALLLWRKARPRTLLIWVLVFQVLPLLIIAALWGLTMLGAMGMGEAEMARLLDEQVGNFRTLGAQADRIYATGSFLAVTAQRAKDMAFMFSNWPFVAFNVLAMMLLGLYAGKRHVFADIRGNLPLIRKVWLWGLIIGLIGSSIYVYFGQQGTRGVPSPVNLASLTGQAFGAPALALFYMATLTLLAERARWRSRLAPLANAGRMALTNYLLQSVVCTTLFYGYGFGLYGKIGIAGGIMLTAAIFLLEVAFSTWWLGRFRFGPLEWLWRTLTYGRRQAMRGVAAQPAGASV